MLSITTSRGSLASAWSSPAAMPAPTKSPITRILRALGSFSSTSTTGTEDDCRCLELRAGGDFFRDVVERGDTRRCLLGPELRGGAAFFGLSFSRGPNRRSNSPGRSRCRFFLSWAKTVASPTTTVPKSVATMLAPSSITRKRRASRWTIPAVCR